MKTRFAIGLALAAASLAALPVSASAQALPPYEITTSVRSMGLEPISPPVRRGARYVLRAIDGRGVEVRIFADALNGRILFAEPVGYGAGPAYAERSYPPSDYPEDDTARPRRNYGPQQDYAPQGNYEPRRSAPQGYQRQGSYDQQGNYDQQQGNYQRQPPHNPGEPSVIYAPRDNAGTAQPPARAPSAAKPAAPKVAAKPAARPAAPPTEAAAPAESTPPEQPSDVTTGATPSPPPAENPALAIPPVQNLE